MNIPFCYRSLTLFTGVVWLLSSTEPTVAFSASSSVCSWQERTVRPFQLSAKNSFPLLSNQHAAAKEHEDEDEDEVIPSRSNRCPRFSRMSTMTEQTVKAVDSINANRSNNIQRRHASFLFVLPFHNNPLYSVTKSLFFMTPQERELMQQVVQTVKERQNRQRARLQKAQERYHRQQRERAMQKLLMESSTTLTKNNDYTATRTSLVLGKKNSYQHPSSSSSSSSTTTTTTTTCGGQIFFGATKSHDKSHSYEHDKHGSNSTSLPPWLQKQIALEEKVKRMNQLQKQAKLNITASDSVYPHASAAASSSTSTSNDGDNSNNKNNKHHIMLPDITAIANAKAAHPIVQKNGKHATILKLDKRKLSPRSTNTTKDWRTMTFVPPAPKPMMTRSTRAGKRRQDERRTTSSMAKHLPLYKGENVLAIQSPNSTLTAATYQHHHHHHHHAHNATGYGNHS